MPTPRNKQVITTVRESDLMRIDQHAAAQDVSRAALVYRYVMAGIAEDDAADPPIEAQLMTERGPDGRITLVSP